uniref:Putative prolipoprotein diacylglyceryl transferase n=1 Tax=termite gut metagenome TaxID=433724 RepID=S0DDY7_9ZZZZ
MAETISFPGLGLDLDINRVAFTLPEFLGSRPIYWYGIFIAIGLLCGILYFFKRTKTFGIDADRAMDVILVAVLFSVVGARLYYVIFSWSTYREDPIRILFIWEGGLAVYGAIIAAFLAGYVMCRIRQVKYLPALDLASGSLLIGQAIGRWGNFFNVEAFGANTSMPWGMTSPSIVAYLTRHQEALAAIGMQVNPNQPVHPTFLYESLWCLAGFIFIVWFAKHRRFDGQLTLFYLGWYGLGRFFIEGMRTDSLLIGSIRVSQILALLCFLVSAFTMIYILSKIKREGDDDYLRLYVDTKEGQAVIAGNYYKNLKKAKVAAETGPQEQAAEIATDALGESPGAPEDNREEAEKPAGDDAVPEEDHADGDHD